MRPLSEGMYQSATILGSASTCDATLSRSNTVLSPPKTGSFANFSNLGKALAMRERQGCRVRRLFRLRARRMDGCFQTVPGDGAWLPVRRRFGALPVSRSDLAIKGE